MVTEFNIWYEFKVDIIVVPDKRILPLTYRQMDHKVIPFYPVEVGSLKVRKFNFDLCKDLKCCKTQH